MDFGLTQEQQMIVETVRTFCETELYPHEDLVERLGEVPREIADDISPKSHRHGLLCAKLPRRSGWGWLKYLEFTLLERELGRPAMALSHYWGRPQNILMAWEASNANVGCCPLCVAKSVMPWR